MAGCGRPWDFSAPASSWMEIAGRHCIRLNGALKKDGDCISQYHPFHMEGSVTTTLVSNGCVDFKGKIADKQTTGGWKAAPFIIVNEVAERLAFFAIAVNMVRYLVYEMRQSLPTAATHVTNWIGASYVLTLFGAFIADAYLGRFKTIITFSCIYAVV
nr:protein NRT1/ PTR FAMILY 8.1-like [Malus domestica]